jgi:hypothetical protein
MTNMKHAWTFLAAIACLVLPPAESQTANILSHSEIVANPPDTVHFEKSIGNFTSAAYPSYFLGTSSNGYIYDTRTGQACSLGVPGYYYERSKPFTWGTDKYPGLIVSLETSTVWLESPVNGGGNICNGWHVQEINPNRGAHELHVADLDGDGKMDVVASGQQIPNDHLTGWIAFQNSYNSWPLGSFAPASGDSLDLVAINGVNGSARTNVVVCNPGNNSL